MGFCTKCAFIVLVFLCGCHYEEHATQPESRAVAAAPVRRATAPFEASPAAPMNVEAALALIDHRQAWNELGPIQVPRYPADKYLKGLTIIIDPGHGGADGGEMDRRAGYKQGPTGLREADINLRVATLLRRLLADAGVNVIMTRYGDDTISLRDRAEVANNAKKLDGSIGADLFVSVHHNAGSRTSNFTSVWYHGDVDGAEVSLDVARHVSIALAKEMHTDVGLTSPIFSDYLMYNSGFGVLRASRVPCVLCECSFMTKPEEEQRLGNAGYNLREAYGIYVGLCDWAYEGRPTQCTPVVEMNGSSISIKTTLDEGLPGWWGKDRPRIIESSILATWDGKEMKMDFDPKTRILSASIDETDAGEHLLVIHHENMFKHHNYPQQYRVQIATINSKPGPTTVESIGLARPARRGTQPATTRPTSQASQRK